MPTVGVIGAGIAGLAAAYQLDQEGALVQVFEASDQVGGAIRSERTDGFLVGSGESGDAGPDDSDGGHGQEKDF